MGSKDDISQQLSRIIDIVEQYPTGVAREDILERVEPLQIHDRTLQRRLRLLVDKGQLKVSGRGRSSRYHALAAAVSADDSRTIPLSEAGREVQTNVRRPQIERTPVGYRRGFLDAYHPNVTHYLSSSERAKLAEIGKSPVSGERPAGTYARNILNRLLVDLSWNSSRLEGNTYSLLDTQRLIAFGTEAEGKSPRDAQMILNHKEAIEFLVEGGDDVGFNRHTILSLHALLASNLLGDPRAEGRLRSIEVVIGKSAFTPLAVPQLIEENFNLILEKAAAIEDPFEQSFFAMVHLPYLQPFEDVNKRVSRLAANIPFLKHNLSPLSFIDVPEKSYIDGMLGIYELNRIDLFKDVYMWAYERSTNQYAALRHSLGEPDIFRLKYRMEIQETIALIVGGELTQSDARKFIDSRSMDILAHDRSRFIETVETELLALHNGNIARYKISPNQFRAWQEVWSRG